MSFAREYDDLPWEARKDAAKVFRFYPKSAGLNVQVEDSPAPTFTIHDPSGVQIQSGSATVVTVDNVSSVQFSVDAIATLGERYSARVTWQVDGAASFEFYVRPFDVVLNPFDQALTSANEMAEDRPEVLKELDKYGQRLGYPAGNSAQVNAAALCACRARLKLISWIKASIAADGAGARPALVFDRSALGAVERELALEHLYNATANNPLDGEGKEDKLAQFHRAQAKEAWSLIKLEYDATEDLVPDSQVEAARRFTIRRRVQG